MILMISLLLLPAIACADAGLELKGNVYEWIDAPQGEVGKIYIDEELPTGMTVKAIEKAEITLSEMFIYNDKETWSYPNKVYTDSSGYFEDVTTARPSGSKFRIKVGKEGYLEVVKEFMHPIKRGEFERSIVVVMVREG